MSLFEHLARDDAREQERLSGNRAIIAAQTRVQDRFATFLANAGGPEDRDARISLLDDEIREVVAAVMDEYGVDESAQEYVRIAALEALGAGHASDCSCGFCKNKGKGFGNDADEDDEDEAEGEKVAKTAADYPGHDYSIEGGEYVDEWNPEEQAKALQSQNEKDKGAWKAASLFHFADGFSFCECGCEGCDSGNHCESDQCISSKHSGNPGNSSGDKTSASTETGDSFVTETLDLGSSSGTDGVQDVGSPKIDKGQVPGGGGVPGADGLAPIDVPSKQHPNEIQDMHDTPDYWAGPIGTSETGKSVDADKPLQPEFNVAPATTTWTGTEGQAAPVTSKLAKWQILT